MTIEERAHSLPLSLRGRLVRPGDNDFDTARHVWNGMIDRHPGLIVRAADAADVIATVNLAREQNLPLAIRGGGHSAAGSSVSDGGVTLDLSGMKGIQVDPAHRTARAEPGLTLAEFDAATQDLVWRQPAAWCRRLALPGSRSAEELAGSAEPTA